jgi:AraC family transcriptional regulator of adaptative response / DNA-3-methyladenine glycosylase II
MIDDDICYRALEHRDPRFDGRFVTAVSTTGIYCRPVCPAPTPKRANCRFYSSAAAAEQAGFRACRRCRPEAAPGSPAWAGVETTVQRALRLIEEGALDTDSVDQLAARLGVGDRHLRRLFVDRLGATPSAVARTQRLHLAKRLVETTDLPMTDVALAAGFQSLRRFNDAFAKCFRQAPTALRREQPSAGGSVGDAAFVLSLIWRPPFDWRHLLDFLRQRALPGIEACGPDFYTRTIHTAEGPGTVHATVDQSSRRITARLVLPSPRALRPAIRRLRAVFDLDADSAAIDADLAGDPALEAHIRKRPGIRVPGAWDPFEYACRAVIGQQVSVKGARTVALRLARRLGTPLPCELRPQPAGEEPEALTWLFPRPEDIVDGDLGKLGMPGKRAESVRAVARAFCDGPLADPHSLAPNDMRDAIVGLPGLGPWTAESIAMRALGDPDAFPGTDLGVLKALGLDLKAAGRKALSVRSDAWRPWRAYATVRLWTMLED